MALRVLLVETKPHTAQTLASFFEERDDELWHAWKLDEASSLLDLIRPDLLLMDLHLPEEGWLDFLRSTRQLYPLLKIIITTKRIDLQRELLVKQQGIKVFVRQPFTKYWLEQALQSLGLESQVDPLPLLQSSSPSSILWPMQIKIILPFLLVGLLFAISGAYVTRQLILSSLHNQFNQRLEQASHAAFSWMAGREEKMLSSVSLIADTEGLTTALRKNDTATLNNIVSPIATDLSDDAVYILDNQGVSLLSLHRSGESDPPRYDISHGETTFQQLDFVQKSLIGISDKRGDKYVGVILTPLGRYLYVSGPIYEGDQVVGVVLVGQSLKSMILELKNDTNTDITLYNTDGMPFESTLYSSDESHPMGRQLSTQVISTQNTTSLKRQLAIGDTSFEEIFSNWEARGNRNFGILGVALEPGYTMNNAYLLNIETAFVIILPLILLLLVGIRLSSMMTSPIRSLIKAADELAQGNAVIKVDNLGNDEIAALTHAFNAMVVGLQESAIFRDLMGYSATEDMRQNLRQTFNVRDLRLEGQETIATVLATDVRDLTTLKDTINAGKFFELLNEYFNLIAPIAAAHNGVINKLDGDAMLVYFGVLPTILSPSEGALQACQASIEMLHAIEAFTVRCQNLGLPPMITEIGIDTGQVTIGGVSVKDHLHYTVIGSPVKNAQYLESLSRTLFNESGILLSDNTVTALVDHRVDFNFDFLGTYLLRGNSENTKVYRLLSERKSDGLEIK